MNGLAEIQKNMRSIEKTMAELTRSISAVSSDIDALRNKDSVDSAAVDYDTITRLAYKFPIRNKALKKFREKNLYIKGLAILTAANDTQLEQKLLFLTRIASGLDDERYTAEYIHKLGMDFDKTVIADICTELGDMKYSFITDCFIIVGTSGDEDSLAIAAGFADVMGISDENVTVAAALAKAVLTGDFSVLDKVRADNSKWGCGFSHYIPEKWLANRRVLCGKYLSDSDEDVQHKNGDYVPEGKLIVKYRKKSLATATLLWRNPTTNTRSDVHWRCIYAVKSGTVYYIPGKAKSEYSSHDDFEFVYTVSCFDDYVSFYNWFKNLNGR